MPSFDLIVCTYNRLEYTKRTIASLIDSGAVAACQRFIIVDNASEEAGMAEFLLSLKTEFGASIIFRSHNRGWGVAMNDALNMSRAEYVFLSNNDVIYSHGFHERMLNIMHGSERYISNGTEIGILGVWRHTAHSFVNGSQNNPQFREMDNVPAVGWMVSKRAMREVGLLPENGPCFTKGGNGEDTGYVNRMKEKGYLVGVPEEDLATHIDGY